METAITNALAPIRTIPLVDLRCSRSSPVSECAVVEDIGRSHEGTAGGESTRMVRTGWSPATGVGNFGSDALIVEPGSGGTGAPTVVPCLGSDGRSDSSRASRRAL